MGEGCQDVVQGRAAELALALGMCISHPVASALNSQCSGAKMLLQPLEWSLLLMEGPGAFREGWVSAGDQTPSASQS